MKVRCIAIDDEPIALMKLCNYIEREPSLELIERFDGPTAALDFLRSANAAVDAVFVDINMPDISGLELAKLFPDSLQVVFVTAYADHALESYRLGAIDYLLKPYNYADFQRAVNRLVANIPSSHDNAAEENNEANHGQGQSANALFIKVDSRWVKLDTSDILFFKSYGDYIQVFIRDAATPFTIYSTIAAVQRMLPSHFLQVHRSYVVNMEAVDIVERARIVFGDNRYEIPVGNSYRDTLFDFLASRTLGKDTRRKG